LIALVLLTYTTHHSAQKNQTTHQSKNQHVSHVHKQPQAQPQTPPPISSQKAIPSPMPVYERRGPEEPIEVPEEVLRRIFDIER
jgi:hypothetical protein